MKTLTRPLMTAYLDQNPVLRSQIEQLTARLLTAPDAADQHAISASWKKTVDRVNSQFDAVVGAAK